jgi:hypothetical protein
MNTYKYFQYIGHSDDIFNPPGLRGRGTDNLGPGSEECLGMYVYIIYMCILVLFLYLFILYMHMCMYIHTDEYV